MKFRKGDIVRVMTGKDVGEEGAVVKVLPKEDKVIVSGVNTATRHVKARRANQKAGLVHEDMPIHASNVMYLHDGKPVRLGYQFDGKGNKVRVAKVGKGKTEVIG
jgi:large subunit ribosomal protein L24